MANAALSRAVHTAGGQSALAKTIKVSRQRLHGWLWLDRQIPPEFCVKIERATKVKRKDLNPDFPWGEL